MRGLSTNRSSRAAQFACAVSMLCLSVWSAATDYALILPKAVTSLLLDVAAAGDRLVAVGERGHILYSDDGGTDWTQARVPTSVMLTRVFFIDAGLGWAVGHDGNILVSRDGGVNWELQRDGVTEQARSNEDQAARAKGVVDDLRARLASSTGQEAADLQQQLADAERKLDSARETLQEPVYPPPLMDIWFADEARGWAAGAFGTLLHTANGGRNWDDWGYKVENPDELHFNGVAGGPDGTLYLASEWGYVFRSVNSGESWAPVATSYEGSFFGVAVNPATWSVFAYGLRGHIYRSTDRGESWEALDSGAGASLFGASGDADGGMVFVGQDGTAVRTADDGASFQTLDTATERGLYGVVPAAQGRWMVTGDGGSATITAAPEPGR